MTITLTREEAQQLLVALQELNKLSIGENAICLPAEIDDAMEVLEARLAQPEPEPVAWLHSFTGYGWQVVSEKLYPTDQPLYIAPPQREWQGLTDEEIKEILDCGRPNLVNIKKAEQKLKDKNT
jgi:hypothetical protein